jgi:hypothetical protein
MDTNAPGGQAPVPLPLSRRRRVGALVLLDDEVASVLLHDALHVRLLMARNDREARWVRANRLVLRARQAHLL